MVDYSTKIPELQANSQMIWKLQCQNLYKSKNLGALAVRECIQNSVDALNKAVKKGIIEKHERCIRINIQDSTLTIIDNGIGMDLKTIHNKFLSLGETTKQDSTENVGGFGIAKAVILGCGTGFIVHTQDNKFTSKDLGRTPVSKTDFFQGTKITLLNVQIGNNLSISDNPEGFISSIKEYIETSDIDIPIKINGELCSRRFTESRKTRRDPHEFGIHSRMIPDKTKIKINVYKDNSRGYKYVYVRLRGLTQFRQYLGWNANCNIVIDINTTLSPTSPNYPFLTSREELTYHANSIIEAIRDKVTQSPLSITSEDYFKESFYDNKTVNAEQARRITSNVTNDSTKEVISEVNALMEKVVPDNHMFQNSVAYKSQQYIQEIEDLAEQKGMKKQEFVKTLTLSNIKQLDNPLEYSWLIWEDKNDSTKKINKKRAVECIVIWDSLLRLLASNVPRLQGTVFYPGLVCQPKTLGICVEKQVNSCERTYVMVNPFEIPLEDDTQIALYLMGVASHELAHFLCGTYEAHGETFAYTREEIMNSNLSQLSNVIKLIKTGKFKKTLKRLTKNTSTKEDFVIDFTGKSLQEIVEIAKDYDVDFNEFKKYNDKAIFRMRLIMAIKKSYREQN